MRNILVIFFAISAILFPAERYDDRSIKVNSGGTLAVELVSCDIIINTWNKNEVLVSVSGEDLIEIRSDKNNISIHPASDKTIDKLQLNIPSDFNLKIKVSAGGVVLNGNLRGNLFIKNTGGNVSFNDVNGNVNIENGGGDIKGMNISGNADIHTTGGDLSLGQLKGRALIETGGGNIKILSADKIERISTIGGNIIIGQSSGKGSISTGGGNIDIKSASGILKISSGGGDLKLDNSSGKIILQTGAGLIRVKQVKGNMRAETESGDINVSLNDNAGNIDILSRNGTIRLNVPGTLHADILARTKDSNWWRNDISSQENIRSDFKIYSLQRHKSTQEVECTYKINGGGSKVRVLTSNGKIIIKKI